MDPVIRAGAALDRVIAPLSRQAFLSEYWGKSFLRMTGTPGRFASFLPWEELNAILQHHPLAPPRFRLSRNGKTIDSSRYVATNDGLPRVLAGGLTTCLSEGATLILDHVDALAPRVGELAEACEEVLRTKTQVNLYASWKTQPGFDLHWDAQDTLIVQLSGRKSWKVYAPTRLHPLRKDIEKAPKPAGEPVWAGSLEDGDVLYIPRGTWHLATSVDEPSLHLTVTIIPADGVNLVRWLADRLKTHAEIRRNVPNLASESERHEYVSSIRGLIAASVTDAAFEEFVVDWESRVPVRPHVDLPSGPVKATAHVTMDTRVRLANTRRLSFERTPGDGAFCFVANGARHECSPTLVPALERLRGTSSHRLGDLCEPLSDGDRSKLVALLTALAMEGLVAMNASE